MTQKALLDIVFSPQGYTLKEIQDLVKTGTMEEGQLAAIFDSDTARQLLSMAAASDLPATSYPATPDECNHIVFWGAEGSGKTTVIGTLLALPGFRASHPKREPADERTLQLQALFRNRQTLQVLPSNPTHEGVVRYPTLYRKYLLGKRYPIQLTEALPDTPLWAVVDKEAEQVHVLCIDCRQDLPRQMEQLEQLVDRLSAEGYLDHTNGIYLLVTKSDLMQAPRHYRENAAQALVTSNMPTLWRKVQNICFAKQIYNTMPIAYSAGDFLLKDVAVLNTDDNECLMREALLPKCQPRRTLLGRLLSKGKRHHAVLAAFIAMAAAGYGAYKAYEAIEAPPTTPLRPFNYRTYFSGRLQSMGTMSYEESRSLYGELGEDLAAERTLHTTQGSPILSASDYRYCESQLTNRFAKTVAKECAHVFSTEDWSQHEQRLRSLQNQIEELKSHESLSNSDLEEHATYLADYFIEVKPLLAKSEHCSSLDDVNYVTENCEQWKKYPYENDTLLYNRLQEAPEAAYASLARSYENSAKSKLDQMMERMGWVRDNPYTTGVQQYINRVRSWFSDETSDLIDSIDELLEDLDSKSGYDEVKRKLERTRRSLQNGYEETP